MPFTDSDLRALEPREKQYRVATGDGLYESFIRTEASTSPGFTATHLVVVGSSDGTTSVLTARDPGSGLSGQHGRNAFVWTNCVSQERTPGS